MAIRFTQAESIPCADMDMSSGSHPLKPAKTARRASEPAPPVGVAISRPVVENHSSTVTVETALPVKKPRLSPEKPSAPKSGGFDRLAYQRNYMRDYMRRYRAKKKAAPNDRRVHGLGGMT